MARFFRFRVASMLLRKKEKEENGERPPRPHALDSWPEQIINNSSAQMDTLGRAIHHPCGSFFFQCRHSSSLADGSIISTRHENLKVVLLRPLL
jgi:hypothetical protein